MVTGVLAISIAGAARAETSKTFAVSATIAAGCAVDSLGTSGNAGTMGTLTFTPQPSVATTTVQASLAASQTIVLRCTPGVSLTMSIDGGLHQATGRTLQLGTTANRLAYGLCADTGCTQAIGINQATPITVTAANMNDVRLPIYGRLTLPGTTPPGTYTDTVTVTLSW
ncbi:MAG: spore coat U domain-containing protein [Novosphingobium sp.]